MNQMLPKPRFWADAAAQCKTRFSMVGEMMILILLYLLASFTQSLILAIPMTAWIFGEQGQTLMQSAFAGATPQSLVIALLEKMPDWMSLVSLFACKNVTGDLGVLSGGAAAQIFFLAAFKASSSSNSS